MKYKYYFFGCILLFSYISGMGQQFDKAPRDSTKNLKVTAMPVLFYLPETGLGYGGLGIGTFRFKNEPIESYPSSVQMAISFTSKKQLLIWAPYELYWDNEKWRFIWGIGLL